MLADRDYMRERPIEFRRTATAMLLFANAAAFLLQCYAYGYPPLPHHADHLALSVAGLRHGFIWQLVTFQFMHAGLWHLLGNGSVIYTFGLPLEESLGRRRFLGLYLLSGILGGVVQAGLGFVFPNGQFAGPTIGASAGALGLLAGFATLSPRQSVLPFWPAVQARHLLLVAAILTVTGMIFPTDNLANGAHLGGLLGGVLFIRAGSDWPLRWRRIRAARTPVRRAAQHRFPSRSLWPAAAESREDDLSPEDFVSREVDPILDKISAHGIHSLTERERRILESARARMARR